MPIEPLERFPPWDDFASTASNRVTIILLDRRPADRCVGGTSRLVSDISIGFADWKLIVAPYGAIIGASGPQPCVESAIGPWRLLSPQPTFGAAVRAAIASTSGDLLLIDTDPDWTNPMVGLQFLPLLSRTDVVAVEAAPQSDGWWSQMGAACERCLARILMPVSYTVNLRFVLARAASCREVHNESQTEFALEELVDTLACSGAQLVSVQPQSTTSSRVPISAPTSLRISERLRYFWNRRHFSPDPIPNRETTRTTFQRCLILIALWAVLFLPRLNAPLLEPDEGRHAEIAREMLLSGDWLSPQFLHEPYLDKPPMLYWLCGLSLHQFGIHAWAARLVPAVASLVTVLSTYLLGRRLLLPASAFVGAIILVTSVEFVACGRFLILEGVLTMLVVASLLAGAAADGPCGWSWRWWGLSAICCAAAVLTKGPVAVVLITPPLVAWQWLTARSRPSQLRLWSAFLLFSLAIALPWFVTTVSRRPEFASYFLWQHNLNRFLSGTNHPQSWWFYVPVLLIGVFPWTVVGFSVARFICSRNSALAKERPQALGLLILWAGWCLTFFTLAAGKLPYYILSCFPALALLIGDFLVRLEALWRVDSFRWTIGRERVYRGTWLLQFAALGIAPVMWMLGLLSLALVIACTIGWLLLLGLTWRFSRRLNPVPAWNWFVLSGVLAVAAVTHIGLAGWQERHAILPSDPTIRRLLSDANTRVLCVNARWGSVPFDLGRDDVQFLELPELAANLQAARDNERTILLTEHKLGLAAIEAELPSSLSWRKLADTHRATVLELIRR